MPDITNPNERGSMPTSRDDLRISDADRDRAMATLRAAFTDGRLTLDEFTDRLDHLMKARTQGDLSRITRDLAVAAPVPAAPASVPGSADVQWSIAVMGEDHKTVRAAADGSVVNGIALMGESVIDLRRLPPESGQVTVNAFALMGEVKVLVPDGADVELEGFALMGEKKARLGYYEPVPGGLRVRVQGFALMGSIEVVSSGSPDDHILSRNDALRERRELRRELRRRRHL